MAQDVNGKELKVGDLVKVKADMAIKEFQVGDVFEIKGTHVTDRGIERITVKADSEGEPNGWVAAYFELVEEVKLKGDNMFKFKVGDKVRVTKSLEVGAICRGWSMNYSMEKFIGVEAEILAIYKYEEGVYMLKGSRFKFPVEWLEPVEETKLTPKLITSLDELQVGDYFKDSGGYIHEIISINYSLVHPIDTADTCFNLDELLEMGAYKVKVEPYEMVEVKEEVKPKLYKLVEGEAYVKLEEGDEVTFKGGLVYKVARDDSEDVLYPYKLTIGLLSNWIEAEHFIPENIISINGVNIHEE